MPAPTILSVTPNDQETDVVLGTQITVLFDSLMDHTTLGDATFSLTGPGQTQIISPDQLIADDPQPVTGREYITGTFAFDDTQFNSTRTLLTFTASRPLRPNVTYQVLILGSGGALTSAAVKNASAVSMVGSYTWSFTTGQLNLVMPPPSSPVAGSAPQIDPSKIIVIPRQTGNQVVGTDLSQEIDLIFPGSVSLTPYDPTPDILTSIEAILGDPSVVVPTGLTVVPAWSSYAGQPNRKLTLTISGWPSS